MQRKAHLGSSDQPTPFNGLQPLPAKDLAAADARTAMRQLLFVARFAFFRGFYEVDPPNAAVLASKQAPWGRVVN